jgi:TolA-binding protein
VNSSALIERSRSRFANVLPRAVLLFALAATPGLAQQSGPPAELQQTPPEGTAAPAAVPAAQPPDRIGRLEQQIADLQTMVAALESLVKTKPDVVLPQESAGDAGQSLSNAAGISARIDALETQVGALSSQLELMTQQLGALKAKLNGDGEPQPLQPPQGEEPLPEARPGRQGWLLAPADPSAAVYADAGGRRDAVCATAQDHVRGGLREACC